MVALGPLARSAAEPFARALDLVLPPRCLSCQEPMAPPGGLCPDCWPLVRFLSPPLCACCGIPLPEDHVHEPGALCFHCRTEPPTFARARAAMLYDDGSRDLILRLKHADALAGVPVLARWMAGAGAEILSKSDALVPVPLHWTRLFKRRYNQSAELARAIAGIAHVRAIADGLHRVRKTPSQGGLSRTERQSNVAAVFAVPTRHRARIEGARVVLIDDVMTTGATVNACAKALLDAGAAQVDVLCLARVSEREPPPY